MKTFEFKWSSGNHTGSFKVDMEHERNARAVAPIYAVDRSGRPLMSVKFELIGIEVWK